MQTESLIIIKSKLDKDIVKMVFCDPKTEMKKAILRPLISKNTFLWQVEKHIENKVFHENIEHDVLMNYIEQNLIEIFKQVNIISSDKTATLLISKKGKVNLRESKNDKSIEVNLSHDKTKQYILSEGNDILPLRDLGIFSKDNQIIKFDKFKQINRFVEIIDEEFKNYKKDEIVILDYGCGKSYLTFIIYHYFKFIKKINVKVVGYDLKADVVKNCNEIAKKYNYENLNFVVGDIEKEKIDFAVDMIVTLHACDTATDYALYNALKNNVEYIFSVPCCQHEINATIKRADEMKILVKHGLIKERFSSLLTDAIRCEILKNEGYKVDVIEIVDFENSPKNMMIRAKKITDKKEKSEDIEKLLKDFNCSQKLYELIYKERK